MKMGAFWINEPVAFLGSSSSATRINLKIGRFQEGRYLSLDANQCLMFSFPCKQPLHLHVTHTACPQHVITRQSRAHVKTCWRSSLCPLLSVRCLQPPAALAADHLHSCTLNRGRTEKYEWFLKLAIGCFQGKWLFLIIAQVSLA